MLIAVLPVTSYAFCQAMIAEYVGRVDGFELRWDFSQDHSVELMTSIRALTNKPMIFTLRQKAQGGNFGGSLAEYSLILQNLAQAGPDYLDLDYQLPADWFFSIANNYPHIQMILSMHIYADEPMDWVDAYQKCSHLPYVVFKLAHECHTGLAALEFLEFCQSFRFKRPRSIIAMGENARFARVLGPCINNFFDYACLDAAEPLAPGQLSIDELLSIYRYRTLNPDSSVYALIGDPVEGSIGHYFHNQAFAKLKLNAVYLKIPLQVQEVEVALKIMMDMKFQGLSVTMPLKQEVSKILVSSLAAINTLKNMGETWQAFNVDGLGALEAYEQHAKPNGKRILIIGNGGAALAIKAAFSQYAYTVEVVARRPKRPGEQAELQLGQVPAYAGIINTLPAEAYVDVEDEWIQSILQILIAGTNVMDIVYQQQSLFQLQAEKQGCHLVPGIDMYQAQARHQLRLWLGHIQSKKCVNSPQ